MKTNFDLKFYKRLSLLLGIILISFFILFGLLYPTINEGLTSHPGIKAVPDSTALPRDKYYVGNQWTEGDINYYVSARAGRFYKLEISPKNPGPVTLLLGNIDSGWSISKNDVYDCVEIRKLEIPREFLYWFSTCNLTY